jgi:hypothetical protein
MTRLLGWVRSAEGMCLIVLCAPFEIVLTVLAPFELMLHLLRCWLVGLAVL